MQYFDFHEIGLKGAFLIDNLHFDDNRGGFTKIYEEEIFTNLGIKFNLSETFSSNSSKNVVRGLHFQINNPQSKLVSVLSGAVWDVIVDLRIGSITFKKWIGVELSADNHRGLYIPKGFAHGFVSLMDNTVMLYQCDGKYDKETDTGIRYDDPDISVEWPIAETCAIHSKRDMELMNFSEYISNPMKI